MVKKKHQERDSFSDDQLDLDSVIREEDPVDEDEENEESEPEDVFAEDENDLVMIRTLENEDTKAALSTFLFEEEVGFNPLHDWSTLTDSESNRYSAFMALDKEGVERYNWKRLNAFQRWMFARACAKHGLHEMFREICMALVKMRKPVPELCMEDIYLELVWDYIETKEYEAALGLLDKFEQAYPDEHSAALRVRGLIHIDMGEVEQGKNMIEQVINLPFNRNIKGFEEDKPLRADDKIDGMIQYEIGYALMSMNHLDLAMQYFNRARNLATMNDNYELTMDIDNARAMVLKGMDDVEM